jgi:hypothetical protein
VASLVLAHAGVWRRQLITVRAGEGRLRLTGGRISMPTLVLLSLKPAANRCRLDRLPVIIVDTACREDAA